MNNQLIYKKSCQYLIDRETSFVYTDSNKKSISFLFTKYIHRTIIITQVTLHLKCSKVLYL